MARSIAKRLFVAWDFSNYIDESSRVIRASGSCRFTPPGDGFSSGRGIVSSMTVTLDNSDNRFSPLNASGALYTHLQNGKSYHAPCYMEVSIDGGTNYYRVFTGVVKLPKPSSANLDNISTVELECRSLEEKYLNTKLSSSLADFQAYHDGNYDESELISAFLSLAGISSGSKILSPGIFNIPWVWLEGESIIEECWRLAAACGGRFYADHDGKFCYESATHWLTNSASVTVQETIDNNDFESAEIVYDDDDLYSSVLVEASPRDVAASDVLWQPDEVVQVASGATKLIVAKLRQPAYTIDNATYNAATGGGLNITSDVSITQTNYAQRVELSITNSHATHTAFLKPLKITGKAVSGANTLEEERNATDHGSNGSFFTNRGDRQRSIRGNVYVQSRAHAASIAEFALRQAENPRLSYQLNGCPGVATRRLGNLVAVQDNTLMDSTRNALIVGIRWRVDSKGFRQDLELIDAANLYPYQSTSPGYFVIGTNKLGSADALRGRVFF